MAEYRFLSLKTVAIMCPVYYLHSYVLSMLSLGHIVISDQSLHAFTFTYDSTLLGHAIFYTEGVFA